MSGDVGRVMELSFFWSIWFEQAISGSKTPQGTAEYVPIVQISCREKFGLCGRDDNRILVAKFWSERMTIFDFEENWFILLNNLKCIFREIASFREIFRINLIIIIFLYWISIDSTISSIRSWAAVRWNDSQSGWCWIYKYQVFYIKRATPYISHPKCFDLVDIFWRIFENWHNETNEKSGSSNHNWIGRKVEWYIIRKVCGSPSNFIYINIFRQKSMFISNEPFWILCLF